MAYTLVHGEDVKFMYGASSATTEIRGLREIPEFSKPASAGSSISLCIASHISLLAARRSQMATLTLSGWKSP